MEDSLTNEHLQILLTTYKSAKILQIFFTTYKSLLTKTPAATAVAIAIKSCRGRRPPQCRPSSSWVAVPRPSVPMPATLPCVHPRFSYVKQYVSSPPRLSLRSLWRPPLCLAPPGIENSNCPTNTPERFHKNDDPSYRLFLWRPDVSLSLLLIPGSP